MSAHALKTLDEERRPRRQRFVGERGLVAEYSDAREHPPEQVDEREREHLVSPRGRPRRQPNRDRLIEQAKDLGLVGRISALDHPETAVSHRR